ncbi:MAG: hypothetical protein ACI8TQ_002456 [Planctomycetota bacterium]|jgi:hypothetical protein
MKKRVLVIGSGKRVREAGLPALVRIESDFELTHIAARTAKQIQVGDRSFEVVPLDGMNADWIKNTDLIYLAVTKDAVPSVLTKLSAYDVSHIDMLIDTPVVRFKHYRQVAKLSKYRNCWVAEDCTVLPWFDVVNDAINAGLIGELKSALFHRSAYAYHGVATAKTLLGDFRVKRGNRKKSSGGQGSRRMHFSNGRIANIVEPRDYSVGYVRLEGTKGSISDGEGVADHRLVPIVEDERWVGFRIGEYERRLDEDEIALLGSDDPTKQVTARQDDLKRVGFLRLLRAIRDGRGGYPVEEAIDDMVVDYHLEKVGRYFDNPFTSPRYGLGRWLLSTLTRATGR